MLIAELEKNMWTLKDKVVKESNKRGRYDVWTEKQWLYPEREYNVLYEQ